MKKLFGMILVFVMVLFAGSVIAADKYLTCDCTLDGSTVSYEVDIDGIVYPSAATDCSPGVKLWFYLNPVIPLGTTGAVIKARAVNDWGDASEWATLGEVVNRIVPGGLSGLSIVE